MTVLGVGWPDSKHIAGAGGDADGTMGNMPHFRNHDTMTACSVPVHELGCAPACLIQHTPVPVTTHTRRLNPKMCV